MAYDPIRFAGKYKLALEAAQKEKPQGGLCGFELEWNLLDSQFRPLLTVGSGPAQQSFVDYLRASILPESLLPYSQLEVFHWMIEWATRPYYSARGAVYEGRLMEAVLIDSLKRAGIDFGDRLHAWHGNLLYLTQVDHSSIPGSWHLAKRRYLERCVDLYGNSLATAGIHSNLSLPDPLLAWDFVHLTATERDNMHLDDYKSQVYITVSRLLRAFAALFIATGASTPLEALTKDGQPVVVVTEYDSVRNLTFPNPPALDAPNLYRSYEDYLRISYELVRQGARFGNNNWTPVRARSFAEPVERLIAVTSEQLEEIYARGLYALDSRSQHPNEDAVEDMARQIEVQNLLARINLPMARVEVRTEDGGAELELDIANLTLKQLLMARFYADPDFGRAFRYDREDLLRARRNEENSARFGLRAEIDNPLTGKPTLMRDFLNWTLAEVRPVGEALGVWDDLAPLDAIASGEQNTSGRLRARLQKELGERRELPPQLLESLSEERSSQVLKEAASIMTSLPELGEDGLKLGEFLIKAGNFLPKVTLKDAQFPIYISSRPFETVGASGGDKTAEILALSQQLIRFPSVTACPQERLEEVRQTAGFICDALRVGGFQPRFFNQSKYPAVYVQFPRSQSHLPEPVMFSGHFDVVSPEPDDSQFEPRIEGDYLWGRGSADMKTVVATYLVWMMDTLRSGPPYPPIELLLVGNEENGEAEPMGTPHVLNLFSQEGQAMPALLVAGERTGERGDELWGEICTQNRGVMRFELIALAERGHTSSTAAAGDLVGRISLVREHVSEILSRVLPLRSDDGWRSQFHYPFIQAGKPGVYNVTADRAVLGVEVRPVPQDDLAVLHSELEAYSRENGLELVVSAMENGIACDPGNHYLQKLIQAVRQSSGEEPRLGRKLPGTSARFAPGGQGIVWGQTGMGPHARDERHFIPSILPYYQALENFARLLLPDAII